MAARVSFEPRVAVDIHELVAFVRRWPWGRPAAREDDIDETIAEIAETPLHSPIGKFRRKDGIGLRRRNVGQFAVIYHYDPPSAVEPDGVVSIRAVRHARTNDVFRGVRETPAIRYAAAVHRQKNVRACVSRYLSVSRLPGLRVVSTPRIAAPQSGFA